MGGCCSSEDSGPQMPGRPLTIGPPQDLMLQIPRPRLDANGIPIRIHDFELDRPSIEQGLGLMAEYLRQRRRSLTIIAVGGAVSILYLQSRQTTHDVDVLGTNLTNEDRALLDEAAHYAESRSSVPLGEAWFNTENTLHMANDIHRKVTNLAIEQNEVIFEQPGLKIVAAPWSYAFCSKIRRLNTQYARSYDLSDAVNYLHNFNYRHGSQPTSIKQIRMWMQAFRIEDNNQVLGRVQTEYQRRFGRPGITR